MDRSMAENNKPTSKDGALISWLIDKELGDTKNMNNKLDQYITNTFHLMCYHKKTIFYDMWSVVKFDNLSDLLFHSVEYTYDDYKIKELQRKMY